MNCIWCANEKTPLATRFSSI